jgi:hypothetical protein
VFAPLTVIVAEAPEHMPVFALEVKVGFAFTVTTTVFRVVHPVEAVPTILYVVVAVGDAVTLAPVVALKPLAGLHE